MKSIIKTTVGDLIDALSVFDPDLRIQIRLHPDEQHQNFFTQDRLFSSTHASPIYKEFDIKIRTEIID